jgi:hypothetical protein
MFPIRFKPFVGENYHNQDFKILVLGESHYLGNEDMKAFLSESPTIEQITKNVVKGYLDYKQTGKGYSKWMNTFTKFTNAINGSESSIKKIVEFWGSSSFYNYVQAPTKGPRIKPTQTEFESSIKAFQEIVEELKPNLIFFWGHRLWDNFPKANYASREINGERIHYLNMSYKVPIMVVPHPSSSKFNYGMKDEIKEYISAVKTVGNNV